MGKITNGINGGFFGKVGNIIGSKWKGIYYMRGRADPVRRKPSDKQREQREKFRFSSDFLQSIAPVIQIGFRSVEFKRSALNAALSDFMRNALEGEVPALSINYRRLSIARGTLLDVDNARVEAGEESLIFHWRNNSAEGNADESDEVLLTAVSDTHYPVYSIGRFTRADEEGTMQIFGVEPGTTFHCYIAMASVKHEKVTNSKYLGEITFPE